MNENTTNTNEVVDKHPMMYELIWQYFVEIYEFFKYIFHDVFLGIDP